MIGKKRTIYCLMKYVIFAVITVGTLSLALFSVGEIEVVPPEALFSDEIRVRPPDFYPGDKTTATPQGTQDPDFVPDTDVPHHGEMIDYEGTAEYCVQCHETLIVKSHKILITYPPPYRGPEVTFRPLQEVLALGMKFEDGMITCISCHDLVNQDKYHLALETRTGGHAQKLCYVCHMEID